MSLTVQADTANKKIIILGAGIIGVTSAYYLAEQGYDVTVIERHADVAQESSYANGAQLCYSCIYPLYSNSIFSAFLFALKKLQLHSHILSNLAPIQSLQSYLIDKSLDKELSSYRNNLFKDSAIEFNKLIQKLHMSFPFEGSGVLQIFFSQTELDNAKNMAKYKAQNGITFSILSHEECIKLQPSLKFSNKKIQGGILMHHDGIGDAHLFTKELAKICQNLGVKFLYNTEVKKLMLENGTITGLITEQDKTLTADYYVVSLGVHSKHFLAPLSIYLNMKFIKGYSISITLDAEDKVPDVGIADPANEIFYAKLGTHFRVAGLTEEVGMDTSINPDKIAILLNAVNDIFPQLNVFAKDNAAKVHKWSCLRPSSATRTPFIGATKYKNLFINTGHGGYGWTLAPASAKYLTELLMNQDPLL